MSLAKIIRSKYPAANDLPIAGDFELQDDSAGKGPYIAKWNTARLGPKPTPAQLKKWQDDYVEPAQPTKRERLDKLLTAHGLTVDDLKALTK